MAMHTGTPSPSGNVSEAEFISRCPVHSVGVGVLSGLQLSSGTPA
jgi:hypothetical protein